MTTTAATLLATGELSWPRGERVGDRYGLVTIQLNPSGITPENADAKLLDNEWNAQAALRDRFADFDGAPVGKVGRLIAEVVESRPSYHVGDLFHGFRPEQPEVGERIDLGRGELFVEVAYRDGPLPRHGVGLRPVETLGAREYRGRRLGPGEFWLKPVELYRAHAQTVNLYFEEEL